MRLTAFILALLLMLPVGIRAATPPPATSYADVHAIIAKNCLACHDEKDAEGDLVLESYTTLMAGGEAGKAIIPGNSQDSPLVQQIEHRVKPFMPPPKKAKALLPQEIAVIRSWIDGGALAPKPGELVAAATTQAAPFIAPHGTPRLPVQAIAYDPHGKLLAIARANQVELRTADTQKTFRTLGPHEGNVNAVVFSPDGKLLIAAGGLPGKTGRIRVWDIATGKSVSNFGGHTDAIYAAAISPDGDLLATGSYDQKIFLWQLSSKEKLRELLGHNGAVFALDFRNDGKVLASGSADRTVKLWSVFTGQRLDTRPESLKDQQALLFTPDGQRLFSAGVDNRIREWKISPTAVEGTNTFVDAHFAHEGAILRLAISKNGKAVASSADDGTVKIWDAVTFHQLLNLPMQPDWPSALAFALDDKALVVGRLDGSVSFYDVASGAVMVPPPPPKPMVASVSLRGAQQGKSVTVKITGSALDDATVSTSSPKVIAHLQPEGTAKQLDVRLHVADDAPLGPIDLTVTTAGGTVSEKFVIDNLSQLEQKRPNDTTAHATVATTLPVTFGGHFAKRGEVHYYAFDGRAGQKFVLDAAAKRIGSKAGVLVGLLDSVGQDVGSTEELDGDPILQATLPADGRYFVKITEQTGAASEQHFYRIAAGDLHIVTDAIPLAGPANQTISLKLLGFNMPTDAAASVHLGATGDAPAQVDLTKYRLRRLPRIAVGYGDGAEAVEQEPNDTPQQATPIKIPGAVSGYIAAPKDGKADVDHFRFHAAAGRRLVIETIAARTGSPVDTRIDMLWPDGKPVQQVQLRAVRDSWINFRSIDANAAAARLQNWEEMDLDQYLYIGGEVVRLTQMPRGPDSDVGFYTNAGKRLDFFGTTATVHALEEKAFIVEPHPPGETLAPNGLPVFTINYTNDDDSRRELGSDSRLMFTAPIDSDYVVRVSDVRGFGGDRYVYRLVIRDAQPDFNVTVGGFDPNVWAGAGRAFSVGVQRIDGFDGPVRVDIINVPKGFATSTPLVIEAGHNEAAGTVYAAADAKAPSPGTPPLKVTATATVDGKTVTKMLPDLPKLAVATPPQVTVELLPFDRGDHPIEIIPGQMTKAWLRVQRNGFKGLVTFDVQDLPYGMIVADIGLNGVLIPADQSERQIFLNCEPWVAETMRPCHARANEASNPTSPPTMVHVRPPQTAAAR